MRLNHRTTRAAFTLVELLVATALILFIMAIMSQAFASGSKTFRELKAAGELQERLRAATVIMRRDLANDHFGPPYGPNRGGPHLGDQRLDQSGYSPPFAGYVEIIGGIAGQGSIYEPAASFANGIPVTDSEGLYSTRSTTCMMRFTVRLPNGPATELYAAQFHPMLSSHPDINAFPGLAPMIYSRWAEVIYFMEVRPGEATTGGLPTYTLRRRVRLLPSKGVDFTVTVAQWAQIQADMLAMRYPDMINPIATGNPVNGFVPIRVPGPEDLNRVYDLRITASSHPTGDDVLLTDVTSFEIKAAWFNNPVFNLLVPGSSPPVDPMVNPNPLLPGNSDEPFSEIPYSTLETAARYANFPSNIPIRWFDTGIQNDNYSNDIDWNNPLTFNQFVGPSFGFLVSRNTGVPQAQMPVPPLRVNIRAVQFKLRIWSPRTETTRQSTMVQEL